MYNIIFNITYYYLTIALFLTPRTSLNALQNETLLKFKSYFDFGRKLDVCMSG